MRASTRPPMPAPTMAIRGRDMRAPGCVRCTQLDVYTVRLAYSVCNQGGRVTTTEPRPVVWARLSGQGRGPARTLDHATITGTAVAIADADGLDAVSIRRVAARMDRS